MFGQHDRCQEHDHNTLGGADEHDGTSLYMLICKELHFTIVVRFITTKGRRTKPPRQSNSPVISMSRRVSVTSTPLSRPHHRCWFQSPYTDPDDHASSGLQGWWHEICSNSQWWLVQDGLELAFHAEGAHPSGHRTCSHCSKDGSQWPH